MIRWTGTASFSRTRSRQKAEARVQELEGELASARDLGEQARAERDRIRQELNRLEDFKRRFGAETPDTLHDRIRSLEEEIAYLIQELASRPQPKDLVELNDLKAARERQDAEVYSLRQANRQLAAQLDQATRGVTELERLRDRKEDAEAHLKLLQVQHNVLKEEIKQFEKLGEKSPERDVRIGVVDQPVHNLTRAVVNPIVDEWAWLETVNQGFEAAEFRFPRRLLNAFHTSLKISDWNSLTVLAGVSGTGKSELPRLYSMFGGLLFEPVAVQPNWDSPQDLFGFFNYMDNKFNAKPLLQAIARASAGRTRGRASTTACSWSCSTR